MFYKKYSIRQIANFLNVNHSTVSRELKEIQIFTDFMII
ncbi:helix-turn-helix domain-containing protein [Mesomycoplasma molare]